MQSQNDVLDIKCLHIVLAMESARELFAAILKFKPDAVRFKTLLGDIKEPSHVK